ncbi:PLP-dependent aminotransferase family protein [Sphingosinithalassobacter portus]|uniref:aminotransferase-like domain-containing protein n=1 Tax=Stakelama portus TaxID=2676234 RepID=UPI001379ED2F|nr:PLP-dependent aminotransferase family protein [Sphingosinithalassobacter portus]
MTRWIPDLSGFSGPIYRKIAEALTDAIKKGELSPGDRLPPQRDMAATLGCDLTTVTRGYAIARQRGLIEGQGKAGSFVRNAAAASISAASQVDTALNTPPVPASGVLQAAMTDGLGRLAGQLHSPLFQYQGAGGDSVSRRAGVDLVSRLGIRAEVDQIVVTAGGQNALHAVASTILRPGDSVACGSFAYPGFRAIAHRLSLDLVPLPAMTAAALEQACTARTISALYVVPTNDNPTTATINAAERERIAQVAARHGIQIIEDDAYGLLAPAPIRSIASFVPQLAWYISSTSKIISPALRVAFLSAPNIPGALQVADCIHQTAVMPPPINAAMIAFWLQEGTFDTLVHAVRGEAAWRTRLARDVLKDHAVECHPQGYHLWLRLPEGHLASELSQKLAVAGIGAIPSDRFAVAGSDEQALRISLGGPGDRPTLEAALKLLAGHLSLLDVARTNLV